MTCNYRCLVLICKTPGGSLRQTKSVVEQRSFTAIVRRVLLTSSGLKKLIKNLLYKKLYIC